MNKAELIHAVAEATKLSQADADRAVAAVLGGITNALVKGEQVVLVGFGTFTVKPNPGPRPTSVAPPVPG